jgi:hypothetical protein
VRRGKAALSSGCKAVATEREPKLEVCSTIDTRYLPFVGRLFIGLPFIPWPLLLERRSLRKARDEAVAIRHLHPR